MTRLSTKNLTLSAFLLAAVFSLTGCGQNEANLPGSANANSPLTQTILSADGNALGSLVLEDLGEAGTKVTVAVAGISPGAHAMHFHEIGKCDAPDFTSSGGHYNPTNAAHGHKMPDGPHAGDMMNVDVAADGTGTFVVTNARVSIRGDHGLPALMDADGTALILHESADDYETQPTGAAGGRIGCAVIGAVE